MITKQSEKRINRPVLKMVTINIIDVQKDMIEMLKSKSKHINFITKGFGKIIPKNKKVMK